MLLAAAEAIGITPAAAATKAGQAIAGERSTGAGALVIVGLATIAGMIEGGAVAVAMAKALRPIVPDLPGPRWGRITVLVAGAGWVAGSLPSQWRAPRRAARPLRSR